MPLMDSLLHQHQMDVSSSLRKFLTEKGEGNLLLFGAGYQGELTLSDLGAMGLDSYVHCFLDNQPNKWGTRIGGVPVKSPEILKEFPADTHILITSGQYMPIQKQLAEAGFSQNVRVMDVSALRNGLYDRNLLEGSRDAIDALHDSFSDNRSREVLKGVLMHRLTGDITHVVAVAEDLQYFPEDIVQLSDEEIFVDGGAFDGDTIRAFLSACGGRFQAIHAFEPDRRNHARLCQWIEGHPAKERIHAYNQALYSHHTELRFNEGPSMSSHIDAEGGHRIDAVSLDEVLAGERASFIKYDLEGAEKDALPGAETTIRRWNPKLAISVYHLACDLWALPELVRSMAPSHQCFLRHYSFLSFETVFYAIPETR